MEEEGEVGLKEASLLKFIEAYPELRTLEMVPFTTTDATLNALATQSEHLDTIGFQDNQHITPSGAHTHVLCISPPM